MRIFLGFVAALIAAVLLSSLLLILGDHMGRAFLWLAPVDPVAAWLLTGALIGGLVGLAAGFRRGGRPLGALGPSLPILAAVVLLAAGTSYPLGEQDTSASTAFMVQVVSAELNVRALPDREAALLGRLSQGMTVEVAETRGEWYRLEASGSTPGGWINSRYVVTVQGAPPLDADPPMDTTVAVVPTQTSFAPEMVRETEPRATPSPPPPPPSPPAVASLQGQWRGRLDGYAARLYVTSQDGPRFSGTLEVEASRGPVSKGAYRIAVEGEVTEAGAVVLRETSVVSAPAGFQWALGYNKGSISASRSSLSGTGRGGGSTYQWFLERY